MARPRVLIADDHSSVLERAFELLSSEYDVVAAVSDGLSAVDAAAMLQPDVVVLDISMPILHGLEAAARIIKSGCKARIVFLTVHEDSDFVDAARTAGAHGYVLKRAIASNLLPTIRAVLGGCCAFPDVWRMPAHQASARRLLVRMRLCTTAKFRSS